jgi:hypothetical protein
VDLFHKQGKKKRLQTKSIELVNAGPDFVYSSFRHSPQTTTDNSTNNNNNNGNDATRTIHPTVSHPHSTAGHEDSSSGKVIVMNSPSPSSDEL